MNIKQENFVAFTKTDFSQSNRVDIISRHKSIETAKRQYKRIEKIYGKMHGHHVWTTTIDGEILCDNRPETVCDNCKTSDTNEIDYGPITIEGKQAFQECLCVCGNVFNEIYNFSHRQNL